MNKSKIMVPADEVHAIYTILINGKVMLGRSKTPKKHMLRQRRKAWAASYDVELGRIYRFAGEAGCDRVHELTLAYVKRQGIMPEGDNRAPLLPLRLSTVDKCIRFVAQETKLHIIGADQIYKPEKVKYEKILNRIERTQGGKGFLIRAGK